MRKIKLITDIGVYYPIKKKNIRPNLTIGKSYLITYYINRIDVDETPFSFIMDDNGSILNFWYDNDRFITISEWREIKINKVLNEI